MEKMNFSNYHYDMTLTLKMCRILKKTPGHSIFYGLLPGVQYFKSYSFVFSVKNKINITRFEIHVVQSNLPNKDLASPKTCIIMTQLLPIIYTFYQHLNISV